MIVDLVGWFLILAGLLIIALVIGARISDHINHKNQIGGTPK